MLTGGWCGLGPTVRASDLAVRHGHISEQGSDWLRWILCEAAQTAKRSPPAYPRPPPAARCPGPPRPAGDPMTAADDNRHERSQTPGELAKSHEAVRCQYRCRCRTSATAAAVPGGPRGPRRRRPGGRRGGKPGCRSRR
ncbi:transposase [Streptomyces sp. NWU339]|uniref:transposase n=1 Tax=Streptomyces sp. NWU339 TaxID=2185284 RepID=UPI0035C8263C